MHCSECFSRTFLPLSGRERIDLDLGTIEAFFWYNTMVYISYIVETEAVNANNKKVYAVNSNVAVRGDTVHVIEVYGLYNP